MQTPSSMQPSMSNATLPAHDLSALLQGLSPLIRVHDGRVPAIQPRILARAIRGTVAVDRHSAATTTRLFVIAGALHGAAAHDALGGATVIPQRVAAVALVAELDPREAEPLAGAKVHALLDRHVVAVAARAREGAV